MKYPVMLIAAMVLALGGCGSSSERGQVVRGAPKADGSNSCKDRCGGQAPAGCYCDATCVQFGDCCADKGTYCDAQPGTCQGHCGGQSPGGCWCDSTCAQQGDCCGDMAQACGASCGAATDCASCLGIDGCNWTGGTCAEQCLQDVACYGPENPAAPDCPQTPCLEVMCALYCEFGFKTGPDGCMICECNDPPPLLGCDGLGMSQCQARGDCEWVEPAPAPGAPPPLAYCAKAGTSDPCFGAWLDQFGNCRTPADGAYPASCCAGAFCGGIAGLQCPDGYVCELSGSYPDAGGKCVVECAPVLCELYCAYGFEKDENGCEICSCKAAP